MRLHVRALTLASAVISAIAYAVCFGLYAVAREATTRCFSYVLHLDLTGVTRIITWGSFFAGLVFWTVAMAVVAAALGWLYNRVAAPEQVPITRGERAPV